MTMITGCGSKENNSFLNMETEGTESASGLDWDESWYRDIFLQNSEQQIIDILLDDFDRDGKDEAFIVSVNDETYIQFLQEMEED